MSRIAIASILASASLSFANVASAEPVKIALIEQHYGGALLAGVPMDRSMPHFVRGRPWTSASAFLKGWRFHMSAIKPRTRSMGGWTAEQLGGPTLEWLAAIGARDPDPALIESVRAASQ